MFAQYLARLASKRVTVEHLAKTERALRDFQRHLAAHGVLATEVPHDVAQRYVDELLRRCRPQTVQKTYLTAIAGAYRFAADLGMSMPNPARLVVVPREPDRPPATYTNDELRRLLEAAETSREDLLLHLFIYTGMRRSEVLGLRFNAIDLNLNVIDVLGKGHPPKFRRIPLHPNLRLALRAAETRARAEQIYVVESNRRTAMGATARSDLDPALASRDCAVAKVHAFRKTVEQRALRGRRTRVMDRGDSRPCPAHHAMIDEIPDAALHEAILRLYASDPNRTVSFRWETRMMGGVCEPGKGRVRDPCVCSNGGVAWRVPPTRALELGPRHLEWEPVDEQGIFRITL